MYLTISISNWNKKKSKFTKFNFFKKNIAINFAKNSNGPVTGSFGIPFQGAKYL